MAYIRWSILFRTLCKYDIYRLLMHSKLYHIQNSTHLKYCESLKYSLNRALCNLDIFTTNAYSSPSKLRTRGIWWAVFYRTLCDTGIFEAYSRHIPNPVKYLLWRILFRIMCDTSIFKTLAYSESKTYS